MLKLQNDCRELAPFPSHSGRKRTNVIIYGGRAVVGCSSSEQAIKVNEFLACSMFLPVIVTKINVPEEFQRHTVRDIFLWY